MGSGWLLFILGGLSMGAVNSWRALDGCCYFLMASRMAARWRYCCCGLWVAQAYLALLMVVTGGWGKH